MVRSKQSRALRRGLWRPWIAGIVCATFAAGSTLSAQSVPPPTTIRPTTPVVAPSHSIDADLPLVYPGGTPAPMRQPSVIASRPAVAPAFPVASPSASVPMASSPVATGSPAGETPSSAVASSTESPITETSIAAGPDLTSSDSSIASAAASSTPAGPRVESNPAIPSIPAGFNYADFARSIPPATQKSDEGPSAGDATPPSYDEDRLLAIPASARLQGDPEELRPNVLVSPEGFVDLPTDEELELETWVDYGHDAPLGYTGPSGVLPTERQEMPDFIPIEDRWRIGFPEWDRYGLGQPLGETYPYVTGHWWDPYNQNVLKGDYPIIGQHTFLNITGISQSLFEYRQLPTPTTPFESTNDPEEEDFFGDPNQFFYNHNFRLTAELSHGDAAFKPADWRIRISQIYNLNYLDTNELGIVSPNTQRGTTRFRDDYALEEWFLETKLFDWGPNYDFVSARVGSQFFQSDFKGFIFSDTNRAVRLFGTRLSNREQFNLVFFDQTEKESNSTLNTFDDRRQNTFIANYFREDTIWPGYISNFSFHYNSEDPSTEFDTNGFLVRPDPAGVFAEHEVDAYYFGYAGDGHINRFNVSHAFYWVTGNDSLNPIAGQRTTINACMAAIEVSYDRDWIRFRNSFFFASGDDDPTDDQAEGFDTIFDNPTFAGGQFSFWQRQQIRLFGVSLVNRNSLVPDLRSNKFQGQSNFVNPGLLLYNIGADFEITPKLRVISNANFLWFDRTQVLEQFAFQDDIRQQIGYDLSLGAEYRPLLNNNILILGGVSTLIPGDGFKDLFDPLVGEVDTMAACFLDVTLLY